MTVSGIDAFLLALLASFSLAQGQKYDYCYDAATQQAYLYQIKEAFISGFEKRMSSPIKMALSINGIPEASKDGVKMNWFIADPVHFPNAVRFPAEAFDSVDVEDIIPIAPSRGHRRRGNLYTLKSTIVIRDPTIMENYVIDFEVHAINVCYDVKFVLHNVGRINMPSIGGFSRVPPGPHIHQLTNKVIPSQLVMTRRFSMTLQYPMEPAQAGNRQELRKDSSRKLCVKAAFDPASRRASMVIRHAKPTFALTADQYQVNDTCMVATTNDFTTGLYQDRLLLFDTGTGASRFQITMTTSTELVKDSPDAPLSPQIYITAGNAARTNITSGQTDRIGVGETRSYEVLVLAYPTPNVTIHTPASDSWDDMKMYTNGRSYHQGYLLLHAFKTDDVGSYGIKATNDVGTAEFTFDVQKKN